MAGICRRETGREEERRHKRIPPHHRVFGCDICLFSVICIIPAWAGRDRLAEEEEEEGEMGKERWEDSKALGRYGNQVSGRKKKGKRWEADGISHWHDSNQPGERRSSARAITRRAFASFASIWSLKTLSYAGIWASLSFLPRVCVRAHIARIRQSDRRCLSRCALHGSRMLLVEEDHVHCVNRDNSDLIGLQADSLCILIGWAPDVSLPPPWNQPRQQMWSSQTEPADITVIMESGYVMLHGFIEQPTF